MGMFDDIRCRYPLPMEGANDLEFQTKDLRCRLDTYLIRDDGTLWLQDYDDGPEGPWREAANTGQVNFYTNSPNGWVEFLALFVRGKLVHIEQTAPPAATRGEG